MTKIVEIKQFLARFCARISMNSPILTIFHKYSWTLFSCVLWSSGGNLSHFESRLKDLNRFAWDTSKINFCPKFYKRSYQQLLSRIEFWHSVKSSVSSSLRSLNITKHHFLTPDSPISLKVCLAWVYSVCVLRSKSQIWYFLKGWRFFHSMDCFLIQELPRNTFLIALILSIDWQLSTRIFCH